MKLPKFGDVVVQLAGPGPVGRGRLQDAVGPDRLRAVDLRRIDDLDEAAHPGPVNVTFRHCSPGVSTGTGSDVSTAITM